MLKKYSSLLLFTAIEIEIASISLNNYITNNSALLSVLTALFLMVIPAFYYFLTKKKETEFTFWFIFYSVFKITPYIFQMEKQLFSSHFSVENLFQYCISDFLTIESFSIYSKL